MTCSHSYREPSANVYNNLNNTAKLIVSFSFPNMEISWPLKRLERNALNTEPCGCAKYEIFNLLNTSADTFNYYMTMVAHC